MVVHLQDIVWIENQPGIPLEGGIHHFISAGSGISGEPLYLASQTKSLYSKWFTTVSPGATSINYFDYDYEVNKTSDKFYVLALRYDPEVLLPIYPHVLDTTLSTGPFSWSKVVDSDSYITVVCPYCQLIESQKL